MNLNLLLTYLYRFPILTLNGLLWIAYAFVDHLGLWVVLGCGLVVLLIFDSTAVRLISATPSRIGGRPAPAATSGASVHLFTLGTLLLNLVAGLVYAEPIPFILAGMWLLTVGALTLLPAEREPLLWRVKGTLLLYALVLLGFKFYLAQAQAVAPEDWAATLGSVGAARDAIARTRDLFMTIGLWATWFIVPVGHCSYLVQRILVNPVSLFYARSSAEDILRTLRRRV